MKTKAFRWNKVSRSGHYKIERILKEREKERRVYGRIYYAGWST